MGPARKHPVTSTRLSLRTRILLVGSVLALLLFGGTFVLARVEREQSRALATAVDNFVEEQRITDRMAQAVMQQLLSVTAPALVPDDPGRAAAFEQAGREVHREIRAFLDRSLDAEERAALERLRESHQKVEVAATLASRFGEIGDAARSANARSRASLHVLAFLDGIDAFLELRRQDLGQIQQEQARAFRFLFWSRVGILGLFLVVMAGLALWVWRRVTPPLEDLLGAAARMAEGDLSARVRRVRDPEFDVVASGFNQMASRLELAKDDLERRNEALQAALDEVQRTQHELIQAEKLAALGRVSAGLAHELNNPLASVVGFAELLERRIDEADPPGPEELRSGFLEPIRTEGMRARDLVRGFLDASRRSDHAVRPVNVRETLAAIQKIREGAFARAGLELELTGAPEAWVAADPQLLQSVILNLVGNAFDAMVPAGRGRLSVTGVARGGGVVLRFDDEGPGFADPDRALEPFYTTKDPGKGTGLGLALVHRLVDQFGGQVRIANREEGGARVTLRLPVVEAPPAGVTPDTVPPAEPSVAATAPSRGVPPEARGLRVLVVDDEAPVRRLQERVLQRMGVVVAQAASAAEARSLLSDGAFDAVVSDVRMPGESGIELYRWVEKAHPALASRFFFLTGDTSHPDLERLQRDHPGMVILKPFSLETYRAGLARVLDPA
jgi:signal transduction histidine kinase